MNSSSEYMTVIDISPSSAYPPRTSIHPSSMDDKCLLESDEGWYSVISKTPSPSRPTSPCTFPQLASSHSSALSYSRTNESSSLPSSIPEPALGNPSNNNNMSSSKKSARFFTLRLKKKKTEEKKSDRAIDEVSCQHLDVDE